MKKFDLKELHQNLFSMQDIKYRDFHSKLMPTVDKSKVIGIRIPVLRKFASAFAKTSDAEVFLRILPHTYYEEDNLHAFLIEKTNDFDLAVKQLDAFLPYVDNWATCDMMNPKSLGNNLEKLERVVLKWVNDHKTYTIRYGIGMLMRYFLDENFDTKYLDIVCGIHSDEYYVNMMKAWFFATALSKQYDKTIPYMEDKRLDVITHNMAVRKALESFRIPKVRKEYIKTLKVK